ncbi:hypothetical protein [Pseudarthrobacter sulfonivorans]|uniref:hypothetical protein n=1 Tax=Pseudarthrobacter sulfonivorans TaxID=121292 RepID=UPI0028673AAF|nr:hypothetical protein [Pseudarthrobacter sulfonivorans]MDR6415597.1 hypothetical protein [Pseudarthrobacter sulfonivorans]
MENREVRLDPGAQREFTTELARLALESSAPDELMVFDEVADEFFADQAAALNPRSRDESVGFGLELALLTPAALAICGEVVRFLADLLAETFKDEAKSVLGSYFRRMFVSRDQPAGAEPPQSAIRLSDEQMRRVHEAALTEGRRLKLPEETTALLGNAIVGALVVDAPGDRS